jgi:hypothetical protein
MGVCWDEQDRHGRPRERLAHDASPPSRKVLAPPKREQVRAGLPQHVEHALLGMAHPDLQHDGLRAIAGVTGQELVGPRPRLVLDVIGETWQATLADHVQEYDLDVVPARLLDRIRERLGARPRAVERYEHPHDLVRLARIRRHDDDGLAGPATRSPRPERLSSSPSTWNVLDVSLA